MTFYHTTNPYTDQGSPDLDDRLSSATQSPYPIQHEDQWALDHEMRVGSLRSAPTIHPHGLEALSAAALFTPPEANMISQSIQHHHTIYENTYTPLHTFNETGQLSTSPSGPVSTNNNLRSFLDPTSNMTSPIDPSLMSPEINQIRPISNGKASGQSETQGQSVDRKPESEHKVAVLLRHFSESPGQWSVD